MPEPIRESCRLCQGATEARFSMRLLGRYTARYFQCARCGLLQTERPGWLDEAYASSLSELDTAAASRNVAMAMQAAVIAYFLMDRRDPGLDVAGGSGLFTRLLRDFGFDWRWSDAFATNVFARGFEHDPAIREYELVTAFECLEHFVDVRRQTDEIFKLGRNVLISTAVLPEPPPAPGQWHYYGPEHGQHVAFYARRTLEHLAVAHGRHLRSFGRNVHLFTRDPVPEWKARLLFRARKPLFLYVRGRMGSLTARDGARLLARVTQEQERPPLHSVGNG